MSIAHGRKARSRAQLEPGVLTLSPELFASFAPLAPTSFSMAWEADLSGLQFLGPLILGFANRRHDRPSRSHEGRGGVFTCTCIPLRHSPAGEPPFTALALAWLPSCAVPSPLPFRPRDNSNLPFPTNPYWLLEFWAKLLASCFPKSLQVSPLGCAVLRLLCPEPSRLSPLPWDAGSISLGLQQQYACACSQSVLECIIAVLWKRCLQLHI